MTNEIVSRSEMETYIDGVVGVPVEVNDAVIGACREAGTFGGLSFELLKEAIRVMLRGKRVWVCHRRGCSLGSQSGGLRGAYGPDGETDVVGSETVRW